MESPIKHIYQWFEQLPMLIKKELAINIIGLYPGLQWNHFSHDEQAVAFLEDYMQQALPTYNQEISRVLILTRLIDYCLYGKDNPTYWDDLEECLPEFVERQRSNQIAQNSIDNLQWTFQARRSAYMHAHQSFGEIKSNYCCDEMICHYEHSCVIRLIKEEDQMLAARECTASIVGRMLSSPDWLKTYLLTQQFGIASVRKVPMFFIYSPLSRKLLERRRHP